MNITEVYAGLRSGGDVTIAAVSLANRLPLLTDNRQRLPGKIWRSSRSRKTITEQQQRVIQAQIQAGGFRSVDEACGGGIRAIRKQTG